MSHWLDDEDYDASMRKNVVGNPKLRPLLNQIAKTEEEIELSNLRNSYVKEVPKSQ